MSSVLQVQRKAGPARWLMPSAVLASIIVAVLFGLGAAAPRLSRPAAPGADAGDVQSVTSVPFGLYGDITMPPLVARLADGGDNLTFVATSNGLYVVAPGGGLRHFLYTPFGIRHLAIVEDVTGDGVREVVVALGDTQVPALRCYDGATWQELWRQAPMARIWDHRWVDCQMLVTGLGVVDTGDAQGLVATSGRCIVSVKARDGAEQWRFTAPSPLLRMVTLADLNGDGDAEVLAGSDRGRLFLLDGRTGDVEWQTGLARHRGVDYNSVTRMVSDIAVLDEAAGKVAVASGDGSLQMYDLREKGRDWDTLIFTKRYRDDPVTFNYLCISPTPDITGDGVGEVLLSTTWHDSLIGERYSATLTMGDTALCDSAGNMVWTTASRSEKPLVRPGIAPETATFEGRPVYLDTSGGEDGQAMALVDLEDGESVLHQVPLQPLNGPSIVRKQPGGDGYLAFSSAADLVALSAAGELLWCYPRITGIVAEGGSFVGDATGDVLLQCESTGLLSAAPSVRMLKMMDGATGSIAWSYEVPCSDLLSGGGLQSVQVTEDLAGGDGVRDIIGCRGDQVLIFNGRDGTLGGFRVAQPASSLDVVQDVAGGVAVAIVVSDPAAGAAGLLMTDLSGALLWSTTTADWLEEEGGAFMMLDDINSDNVSDLAVFSGSRIVVLKSLGRTPGYEPHQTILPDEGYSIRSPETVADSDGDGMRELAYFQAEAPADEPYHGWAPQHQWLCLQSPEDRRLLYKHDLQGESPVYELACGDFDGDACPDSVLGVIEGDADYQLDGLQVVSGKDGHLLWTHAGMAGTLDYSWHSYAGDARLPAMNAGDFNGDGTDDLACDTGLTESRLFSYHEEQHLTVLDVVHDTTLADIQVTPRLEWSSFGLNHVQPKGALLLCDFDGDGSAEAIMAVDVPSLPAYDPDTAGGYGNDSAPPRMAVVDLDSGRLLCTFTGFDPGSISVLPGQEPGVLALAACGGLYLLRTDGEVRVTSPGNGARTGPSVALSWEGPSGGGLSQVFVDGVRNVITGGFDSGLYLGRGGHEVVVQAIDDCGRTLYGPSDLSTPLAVTVVASPWKPAWLVVALAALLAVSLVLAWPRLHRAWRARLTTGPAPGAPRSGPRA